MFDPVVASTMFITAGFPRLPAIGPLGQETHGWHTRPAAFSVRAVPLPSSLPVDRKVCGTHPASNRTRVPRLTWSHRYPPAPSPAARNCTPDPDFAPFYPSELAKPTIMALPETSLSQIGPTFPTWPPKLHVTEIKRYAS